MKRVLFWGILALLIAYSCNQRPKEKQAVEKVDSSKRVLPEILHLEDGLDSVINGFVDAYVRRDEQAVNGYIHPTLGLYIIYRPGVSDTFTKTESLDFDHPIPDYFPYATIARTGDLLFAKLPTFDCGQMRWSKKGLYCDTTATAEQLSRIVNFELEFDNKAYSQSQKAEIEAREQNSYRVIMTSDEPLIFHVQYYQGKWYVTTLDRAYAGCDA